MKKFIVLALVVLGMGVVFAEAPLTADNRININTASMDELMTIPGVGDKIASEIEDYRPYVSLEQFETELGKYLDAASLKDIEANITLGLANLNTATEAELAALPGIGPKIAAEIEEYRPYTSSKQLEGELGKYFDAETIANIEAISTIGLVDLNSASKEELMSIPGVGDKIASEIEDYRPYTSILQFREELGKYLDADALHMVELFVTLN